MSYEVRTTTGTLVTRGKPEVMALNEAMAESIAKDRNARAEKLGIETRYEVRPMKP